MFPRRGRINRRHFESVGPANSRGDKQLVYKLGDEIPYEEFLDDIHSIFPNTSAVVLKVAEEAASDEGEEDRILARGGRAIDEFYDSCMQIWDECYDGVVAMVMNRGHEVTNFVLRLCDNRW